MIRKRKSLLLCVLLLCVLALWSGTASAHELWIEVTEEPQAEELKVEVLWGHIRDYLDRASHEDYRLFMRSPSGQVDELPLEGIGVQARTFVAPDEEGEYVFWAKREAGTYTPGDGITTLSVQSAKTVYQHGQGGGTAAEPVQMHLEMVPQTDLSAFSGGTFKGTVLLEEEPAAGAAISAYGPGGEILESVSETDGSFDLQLDTSGTWLLKANITTEEEGSHDGQDYGRVSRTTTLLTNVQEERPAEAPAAEQAAGATSMPAMIVPFIIGLLLGGAGTLFFTSRKKN